MKIELDSRDDMVALMLAETIFVDIAVRGWGKVSHEKNVKQFDVKNQALHYKIFGKALKILDH